MGNLKVETKLILSKLFPVPTSSLKVERYQIRPIPSTTTGQSEAVLEFDNDFAAPEGGGSHPEEELNIVSNFLAVILEAKVKRGGLRINAIEIPAQSETIDELVRGSIDWSSADSDIRCLLRFDDDIARQLTRAARAYAAALDNIPSDPTFAFFLLVVAVECLSSQAEVIPPSELAIDSKKCERFCLFIDRYLLETHRGEDERNADLLRELLKEVYYGHRSSFVHGGKEVTSASLMADRASSSYFRHTTSGKEVKTPGLRWFARIVRGALLGFVRSVRADAVPDDQRLARLAFEKAMLKIQAARDLQAGHAVTLGDIHYR
jgi:hypothetical protein